MFVKTVSKSLFLLISLVIITCIIYPGILWIIGQGFFPFQANGSMLYNSENKPIGSKLIAQPFTKDEFFQPRPSAASYDASASASSALAPSNYALRARIASSIGAVAKYQNGQSITSDIEKWFKENLYQGKSNIVSQWATLHNSLATAWINADPSHSAYVDQWTKTHPEMVKQFIRDNPSITQPKAVDLAVVFFQNFSKENPGKFPSSINQTVNGKTESTIQPTINDSDIQSLFFDMWRQDNPDMLLQTIPSDFVTTSASGLDPHISLENANYQLDRVASKWATHLKRNPKDVRNEIEEMIKANASAPLGGLAGEKFVNVLELNIELEKRFGPPL